MSKRESQAHGSGEAATGASHHHGLFQDGLAGVRYVGEHPAYPGMLVYGVTPTMSHWSYGQVSMGSLMRDESRHSKPVRAQKCYIVSPAQFEYLSMSASPEGASGEVCRFAVAREAVESDAGVYVGVESGSQDAPLVAYIKLHAPAPAPAEAGAEGGDGDA